ncbi:hypothetical protein Tco_0551417 [Tanacetum coccineum]
MHTYPILIADWQVGLQRVLLRSDLGFPFFFDDKIAARVWICWFAADGNRAATLMMSLGSIYMEVSCEGYLEDVAEINCMENAYYQCLRVNTYFVLAIDESFSGADVAILMA